MNPSGPESFNPLYVGQTFNVVIEDARSFNAIRRVNGNAVNPDVMSFHDKDAFTLSILSMDEKSFTADSEAGWELRCQAHQGIFTTQHWTLSAFQKAFGKTATFDHPENFRPEPKPRKNRN